MSGSRSRSVRSPAGASVSWPPPAPREAPALCWNSAPDQQWARAGPEQVLEVTKGKAKGKGKQAPRGPGYRTLGLLKMRGDPAFEYFEYGFMSWLYAFLTRSWGIAQSGTDFRAMCCWHDVFMHLELDRKATVDLMLLAQMGIAGRAAANEVLWELLTVWALKPEYLDLSHKCTSLVYHQRSYIERPPSDHRDLGTWTWKRYAVPRNPHFDPRSVPPMPYVHVTGPSGEIIPPPQCFQPFDR